MTARSIRVCRWCFTINNYTAEETERIKNLYITCPDDIIQSARTAQSNIKCLIAELEVGEQGTPHIQGYIEFKQHVTRMAVESLLGGNAHIEQAFGSTKDNVKYCTKDAAENPEKQLVYWFSNNQQKLQVERQIHNEDLKKNADEKALEILQDIEDLDETEFEAKHPSFFLRNYNRYKELRQVKTQKKLKTYNGDLQVKNYWIYGPTGTGKSQFARKDIELWEVYDKAINKWFNGYDKQKRIIIDDFPSMEYGNCLAQHIKRWADRYPFTAEIKGAHSAISPNDYELVVTSNYRIEECFKEPEDVAAIKRRFKELPIGSFEDAERYVSITHLRQVAEEFTPPGRGGSQREVEPLPPINEGSSSSDEDSIVD